MPSLYNRQSIGGALGESAYTPVDPRDRSMDLEGPRNGLNVTVEGQYYTPDQMAQMRGDAASAPPAPRRMAASSGRSNPSIRGPGQLQVTQELPPTELNLRPKQAAKPAQQDRWADPAYLTDVASRLITKAQTAERSGSVVAQGLVKLGDLPPTFAAAIPKEAGTILGWNPKDLSKDERELLNRLALAQQAAAALRAKQAAQEVATAAPPGQYAGQMP